MEFGIYGAEIQRKLYILRSQFQQELKKTMTIKIVKVSTKIRSVPYPMGYPFCYSRNWLDGIPCWRDWNTKKIADISQSVPARAQKSNGEKVAKVQMKIMKKCKITVVYYASLYMYCGPIYSMAWFLQNMGADSSKDFLCSLCFENQQREKTCNFTKQVLKIQCKPRCNLLRETHLNSIAWNKIVRNIAPRVNAVCKLLFIYCARKVARVNPPLNEWIPMFLQFLLCPQTLPVTQLRLQISFIKMFWIYPKCYWQCHEKKTMHRDLESNSKKAEVQ